MSESEPLSLQAKGLDKKASVTRHPSLDPGAALLGESRRGSWAIRDGDLEQVPGGGWLNCLLAFRAPITIATGSNHDLQGRTLPREIAISGGCPAGR